MVAGRPGLYVLILSLRLLDQNMVRLILYALGRDTKWALGLLLVDPHMKGITISFNETAMRDMKMKLWLIS